MSKLSPKTLGLIDTFGLSRRFFQDERNTYKSDLWFVEAQRQMVINQSKHVGVVASTSSGKTVIDLLVAIMSGKRTLFLVPNKQLAFEHQQLFYLMGGKFQTKVITGNLLFHNRDWSDTDDRIIFATGHVVEKEIQYGELSLDMFDYIVNDEMQHASSENTVYAKIAQVETVNRIWRSGLSASPGSTPDKIQAVLKHCKLDEFVKIEVPTAGFITNVVMAEQARACSNINYLKAEEIIVTQMQRCLDVINQTSMKMSLGKGLVIDPKKTFTRKDINFLRSKIRGFGKIKVFSKDDEKLSKRLSSNLEQYAFWAHVYELFTAESFLAIEYYYKNNLLKKNTWYAKAIVRDGYANMLLSLTRGLVHPKMEMLGKVALSLKSRKSRFIVFFDNKASALESHFYFQSLGVSSDCVYSGKGMTPLVKTAVIQKCKDQEIDSLNTTDMMREGYNLSVDVVIHYSPPNSPIKMIQRNGRSARGKKKGEIIYIACEHQQWVVPAITRQVNRLSQMDYSSGVMPPLPKRKEVNYQQGRLFGL